MSRSEAADILAGLKRSISEYCGLNERGMRAFNTAITALYQAEGCRPGAWADQGPGKTYRWKCTRCGRLEMRLYNYCADCGASMRDEEGKIVCG